MAGDQRGAPPPPRLVWYNDWRQVAVPAIGAFRPELPVSVIVPYYARPVELERTFAALARQRYPRDLFEVVVVDDGSPEPLAEVGELLLREAPFEVRVVREEDRGYRPARARNTGVRAAAHDILLFLDADMLPEADWLASHARWHHTVPDALTLGLRAHVSVDGVDAEAIRTRPGTLQELFAGRRVDRAWFEAYWMDSDDLTSRADDLFRVVTTGNLGVGRRLFELTGGFDESFAQWGGEDTEFGYRAFTRGALFVPLRDGFAWHQGRWEAGRAPKQRSLRLALSRMAHLIGHPGFRRAAPGRIFTVPRFVVTIHARAQPAEKLVAAVERILSGSTHDLVVRLELPSDHPGREWLRRQLDPDPRVRVAPSRPALEEFPDSPFQVVLPVDLALPREVVSRLHAALGTAVLARCAFRDGSRASITRAWALHRALRTPWEPADFGEVVTIRPKDLADRKPSRTPEPASAKGREPPAPEGRVRRLARRLRTELRRVDGPRAAWWFVRWSGAAVLRRIEWRLRAAPAVPAPRMVAPAPAPPPPAPAPPPSATSNYPLGVEIAALGDRAQRVFAASPRVARSTAGQQVDVVLADTAAEATGVEAPVVALEESPRQLSVPAFDPWVDNPVGWWGGIQREVVGALGPPARLPAGSEADREVRGDDREALRKLRWLEDVAAFHPDPAARAGELARLAATGVVVHLADGGPELEPYLGAELFALMTSEVRGLDAAGREELSVRMRRAALREHSLGSRARQVAERVLPDPPWLPLVSVLVATRRPGFLPRVLATVREQHYPRLELILALHGEGFGEVGAEAAGPSVPLTVLRLDGALPLGSVLNLAARAASGTLLTKLDDDDVYGPDHIWDLVLAHEYSRASVVGKASEFVWLGASDRTIRRPMGAAGVFDPGILSGAATLVTRSLLERMGGWARTGRGEDRLLGVAARRLGARSYGTHSYGFLAIRHGSRHSWEVADGNFREAAVVDEAGWRPGLAGIPGAPPPFASLDDGASAFRAFARDCHERLRRPDADLRSLRDLAAREAERAPTASLRAVARDLAEALSGGDREQALGITATAKRKPDLGAEKIVSHRYRYVWLSVPRAASVSIRETLCAIDREAEVIREASVAELFARFPEARAYTSVAFVRDPCARSFSFYADNYVRVDDEKRRRFVTPYHGASLDFCFDDLCSWLNTPYGSDAFADRHWLSQTRQVALEDGRPADFVGLHERLDADFRAICARLGMPSRGLPRRNTSVGWAPADEEWSRVAQPADESLNERNRALLRERYAEDFVLIDRLRGGG